MGILLIAFWDAQRKFYWNLLHWLLKTLIDSDRAIIDVLDALSGYIYCVSIWPHSFRNLLVFSLKLMKSIKNRLIQLFIAFNVDYRIILRLFFITMCNVKFVVTSTSSNSQYLFLLSSEMKHQSYQILFQYYPELHSILSFVSLFIIHWICT